MRKSNISKTLYFLMFLTTSCKVSLFSFDIKDGNQQQPPPPPPSQPDTPPPPPTPDPSIQNDWITLYPEDGTLLSNTFQVIRINNFKNKDGNWSADVSYCRFTNGTSNPNVVTQTFSGLSVYTDSGSLFSNSYIPLDSTKTVLQEKSFYDDWNEVSAQSGRTSSIQRKLMYSSGNSYDLIDYYQDKSTADQEKWVVNKYIRYDQFGSNVPAYAGICGWQ